MRRSPQVSLRDQDAFVQEFGTLEVASDEPERLDLLWLPLPDYSEVLRLDGAPSATEEMSEGQMEQFVRKEHHAALDSVAVFRVALVPLVKPLIAVIYGSYFLLVQLVVVLGLLRIESVPHGIVEAHVDHVVSEESQGGDSQHKHDSI